MAEGTDPLSQRAVDSRHHDYRSARHLLDLSLAPPRLVPEFGFVDAVAEHTSAYSQLLARLRTPTALCHRCTRVGLYGLQSCLVRTSGAHGGPGSFSPSTPFLTIVTIVATANHYVVDAIAGCAYFLLAWLFVTIANRALPGNVRTPGETS